LPEDVGEEDGLQGCNGEAQRMPCVTLLGVFEREEKAREGGHGMLISEGVDVEVTRSAWTSEMVGGEYFTREISKLDPSLKLSRRFSDKAQGK
jgi:hypothetical protein